MLKCVFSHPALLELSISLVQLWTENLADLWDRKKFIASETVLKHPSITALKYDGLDALQKLLTEGLCKKNMKDHFQKQLHENQWSVDGLCMYVCWLPVKLALPTSSLSRLRAVDQISPHSAVGHPGPRSVAAPGRLSQGRTQRVPDGRPIWPQCSHTVSAKHSSAMGAGACSRENNLSASQLR